MRLSLVSLAWIACQDSGSPTDPGTETGGGTDSLTDTRPSPPG